MYSPAPQPLSDGFLNESDEQAIMYLEKLRQKSPLPDDLIDLNPYLYKPCNLPGGFWYVVSTAEKKRNEFGCWAQTEAATEIVSNSDTSVWRTTLAFLDTQDTQEQRSNWLMQEYKLTEKLTLGAKLEKESRAICRVYLSTEAAIFNGNDANSLPSVVPQSDTKYRKGSTSVLLLTDECDTKQPTSETDGHLELLLKDILDQNHIIDEGDYLEWNDLADPLSRSTSSDTASRLSLPVVINSNDAKQFSSGSNKQMDPQIRDISGPRSTLDDDYLQLNDLADPLSTFTTSDNSSRSTFNLDDYFDSEALIQELGSPNNQQLSRTDLNSRTDVTTNPFDVASQAATSGALVCAAEIEPVAECSSSTLKTKNTEGRDEDHTVKKLKSEQKDEDTASSPTSNNGRLIVSRDKKKAGGGKMKGLKKYFCMMTF